VALKHIFPEVPVNGGTFRAVRFGAWLEDSFSMAFSVDGLAAIVGLGYIVGLKYASIIASGSFLSYLVFIPFVKYIGSHLAGVIPPGTVPIAEMGVDDIFRNYVRLIGIGGIAGAGIMGIIRSLPSIVQSFSIGIKGIAASRSGEGDVARTDRNIGMRDVLLGIVAVGVCLWIFFATGVTSSVVGLVGVVIALVISFLFTLVAARAIGLIGTNPVSGMTLVTLIITSVVLTRMGLSGKEGMFAAMIVGGVVCTALATAGAFISDLKVGYWLGTTPRNQERLKFVGILVAALCVTGVLILLNRVYGFTGPKALAAPQANAMAAVIKALMADTTAPWFLYLAGVFMAITLELIKVPPLPFALGMYLPIQLNTPMLAGGFIAHLVATRSKNDEVNTRRRERGTLIASGFIAGGALMGVVSALIALPGWNEKLNTGIAERPVGEVIAVVAFLALCFYLFYGAKRGSSDEPANG
jgi:putative OPT family oligopeptide transporter